MSAPIAAPFRASSLHVVMSLRRPRQNGLRASVSSPTAVPTNDRDEEKPRATEFGALPDEEPGGLRALPSIESTGSAVVGSRGIGCLRDRPDDDAGAAENELHGSRYLGALRHRPDLETCTIFRSLGDRPCAPLAGWRTTQSRTGWAFRLLGRPSDSGPRGSARHGPRARRAAGSDPSCRPIWCCGPPRLVRRSNV